MDAILFSLFNVLVSVDVYFRKTEGKTLRFQTYPGTCERGLRSKEAKRCCIQLFVSLRMWSRSNVKHAFEYSSDSPSYNVTPNISTQLSHYKWHHIVCRTRYLYLAEAKLYFSYQTKSCLNTVHTLFDFLTQNSLPWKNEFFRRKQQEKLYKYPTVNTFLCTNIYTLINMKINL